jgi:hypothetical protein
MVHKLRLALGALLLVIADKKLVKHATARRVTLRPRRLRRGDYRVTVSARAAALTQRVVLTSRKV